jgi:hypothetical protein
MHPADAAAVVWLVFYAAFMELRLVCCWHTSWRIGAAATTMGEALVGWQKRCSWLLCFCWHPLWSGLLGSVASTGCVASTAAQTCTLSSKRSYKTNVSCLLILL